MRLPRERDKLFYLLDTFENTKFTEEARETKTH